MRPGSLLLVRDVLRHSALFQTRYGSSLLVALLVVITPVAGQEAAIIAGHFAAEEETHITFSAGGESESETFWGNNPDVLIVQDGTTFSYTIADASSGITITRTGTISGNSVTWLAGPILAIEPEPGVVIHQNLITGASATISPGGFVLRVTGYVRATVDGTSGRLDVTSEVRFTRINPLITREPESHMIPEASRTELTVDAAARDITFQWYEGSSGATGRPIEGATARNYVTPALEASTSYWVQARAGGWTVNSATAMVSVSVVPGPALWGFGANGSGELADGTNANRASPVLIACGVSEVAARFSTKGYFLRPDGTVWSLGGPSSTGSPPRVTPALVASGFASISDGEGHLMLLEADGTMWAMGVGFDGALGLGPSVTSSPTPALVASDVACVSAGGRFTLFVKKDGTLWGMGANLNGQLGDGTTINRYTPVQIAAGVKSVAAGLEQSFFIKTDRTLWAMGGNGGGVLGDGTRVERHSPVQVATQVVDVVVAGWDAHALFIKLDGTLWGMGTSLHGELGVGSGWEYSACTPPVFIASEVVEVSTGPSMSVFARADGTVWAMGSNRYGELGIDTIDDVAHAPPVPIGRGLVGLSAGDLRCYVLSNENLSLPAIISQPADAGVPAGQSATIGVAARRPTLRYQWYRGVSGDISQPVPGATYASFTTPALTSDASYWVRVTNDAGSVDSRTATVFMPSLRIDAQPTTAVTQAGVALSLRVAASANPAVTLSYQWYRDGMAIAGATSDTFALPSVQHFHAGVYTVRVSAPGESFTTDPATLEVDTPAPSNSRILNLSTRALCRTGDDVLIPGFVIDGSGTKRLLIRAVGPTLGALGVGGVLPNPLLVLKRKVGEQYVDFASNDDWGTNANADAIRSAVPWAFALEEGSADAALLVDLPVGQYTAVASDVDPAGTGLAIVEFYDADQGASAAKLANLSNRGYVGVGDQIMIPGVIISDEGPKTLLVRAVGPGLAPFGVGGLLADPQVAIYRGGDRLLSNDDWGVGADAAQTSAVGAQVFAFPLAEGSADAAFVVTLPAGAYTVQATGVGETTGVVLVEVYLVP